MEHIDNEVPNISVASDEGQGPSGNMVMPVPESSTGQNLSSSGSGNTSARSVEAHTGAIKKKKEEKRSKRDQRSWDNLLKSASSLTESEKLEVIKDKYTDLYNDYRTSATGQKTAEKQLKNVQREKEHLQSELTKSILSRSKLESLARELQKQNKEIKEENYNRLKEEEEKRREVAANFTEKLNTLTQLMDENKDKSVRLRDENINMTSKLTELYDQFQERENHLANMNRQMELQKKLSDTQLKKLEFEFETEREIFKKERAMLLANLERGDETNKVLQENVNSLQEHLNSYQKQYTDFETTMKRSNKVFDSFKMEMTNLQKTNSELEKDRSDWHSRWKQSTQKFEALSIAKIKISEELLSVQKKLDTLEKLCRKLMTERSSYMQQLKLNNITPITPIDDDAPFKAPATTTPRETIPSPRKTPRSARSESSASGSGGPSTSRTIPTGLFDTSDSEESEKSGYKNPPPSINSSADGSGLFESPSTTNTSLDNVSVTGIAPLPDSDTSSVESVRESGEVTSRSDTSLQLKSVPIADAALASKSDTELSAAVERERASTASDVERATDRGRDMPFLEIHESQARTDLCVPLCVPPLQLFGSDDDDDDGDDTPRPRVEFIEVEPQVPQPRLATVVEETLQSNDDLAEE